MEKKTETTMSLLRSRVWGLGFRVWGLGSRVWIWGLGLKVWVWGLGFEGLGVL